TAIRALPRVARSVRRTAVARHTPPSARARVLAATARRLVQRNPQLRRQLVRPLRSGQRVLRRVGGYRGGGRAPMARGGYGGPGGGYGAPRRSPMGVPGFGGW